MADINHPKTHVEDQELDSLRRQPLSPQHEGIDPLTESDTMLPREDTKTESEKLAKKQSKPKTDEAAPSNEPAPESTVSEGDEPTEPTPKKKRSSRG